jgi:hypothetical protein
MASPKVDVVAVAGKELAVPTSTLTVVRPNGQELATNANANLAIIEVSGKERTVTLMG